MSATAPAAVPTSSTPSAVRTRGRWAPALAAAAGSALVLKAVLIIASGNRVPEAPMAVLYLGGLLVGIVACVGIGLRRQRVAARAAVGLGAAVLLVSWIMGLGDALKPLVAVASDAEHVQVEVPIALAGLALLATAWGMRSNDERQR